MPFKSLFEGLNCASSSSSKSSGTRRRRTKKKSVQNNNASQPSAPGEEASGENTLIETFDDEINDEQSFWEIGKFKIALKRCDNGAKLANDLSDLISERAKLEDNYGKAIKNWSHKWSEHLNKDSSEYETTKDAWLAILESGNKQANVHIDLSKTLINYPVFKIKDWLKRKYQRSIINYKQTKEFEENFEEAQSSWVDLYDKLKKSKKEYEEAIETRKSCHETAVSAESNPKYTPEQRIKLAQRDEKAVEEQQRAREKYKESVIQMNLYQPRYIENMTEAFSKTQNFEQERMLFFKQIFLECHEVLQIHHDERLDELFEELLQKVNAINPQNDIEWWAAKYGTGTQGNWPQFEDLDDEDE